MQFITVLKSKYNEKTKTTIDILLGEEDEPWDDCEAEISQYFAEKVFPRIKDHFKWWR